MEQFGPLAGRLLLALIFILAGYSKLTGWGEGGTLGFMESKGIPFASIALGIAILIELGGGLLIALGVFARWAAFIIFLFLIPVTLIFHPFWADP
ncbi:MAG: DoxX family protein, partial [Gammaproteobacteria bacterium]